MSNFTNRILSDLSPDSSKPEKLAETFNLSLYKPADDQKVSTLPSNILASTFMWDQEATYESVRLVTLVDIAAGFKIVAIAVGETSDWSVENIVGLFKQYPNSIFQVDVSCRGFLTPQVFASLANEGIAVSSSWSQSFGFNPQSLCSVLHQNIKEKLLQQLGFSKDDSGSQLYKAFVDRKPNSKKDTFKLGMELSLVDVNSSTLKFKKEKVSSVELNILYGISTPQARLVAQLLSTRTKRPLSLSEVVPELESLHLLRSNADKAKVILWKDVFKTLQKQFPASPYLKALQVPDPQKATSKLQSRYYSYKKSRNLT